MAQVFAEGSKFFKTNDSAIQLGVKWLSFEDQGVQGAYFCSKNSPRGIFD